MGVKDGGKERKDMWGVAEVLQVLHGLYGWTLGTFTLTPSRRVCLWSMLIKSRLGYKLKAGLKAFVIQLSGSILVKTLPLPTLTDFLC